MTARGRLLAQIGEHIDRLDVLYAQDAEAIKAALRQMLGIAGVPARRVDVAIDGILKGSRASRVAVLEAAVMAGASAAKGLDAATFRAVFDKTTTAAEGRKYSDEKEPTPDPKALTASGSPTTPTRRLRLVRGYAGESTETD